MTNKNIFHYWSIMRAYIVIIFINSVVEPINQPVYKIVLTQKGFPQYLQYVVDTPPIREFTLCVWVRVFEFSDEQTIFTYIVHGNNRIMRLWIEEEGKLIKISIKGETFSSTVVDLTRDTWYHVCLSYQSDFGAWALYFNGRLASCEAAQSIFEYKLPAGGHFIFGHGASRNGSPNGLEGEIYGVNILLISAIEKNGTFNQYYHSDKRKISKTKLNTHNTEVQEFIHGQQIASQTMKNVDTSHSQVYKLPRNFIKLNTPYTQLEYDIGVDLNPKLKLKNNIEVDNLILPMNKKYNNSNIISLWEVLSKNKQFEQFGSHTKKLPTISEYETPPPSPLKNVQDNSLPTYKIKLDPMTFMLGTGINLDSSRNSIRMNTPQSNLDDIETPPPVEKNNEVYGQWTTSSFAKDVLNYLKSINGVSSSQRKVPETIRLPKISDHFPYPSDLMPLKILAPDEIRKRYFQHQINKRESKHPQINVKILENDIRSLILEGHAKITPQYVEITNRGKNKMDKDHRFHRNVSLYNSGEISASSTDKLKSFASSLKPNNELENWQRQFYDNLVNILPYLKSSEFFTAIGNEDKNKIIQKNEMYTNSLSNASKWHNIKFHSNVFSPRSTKVQFKELNPFNGLSFINHSNKINKYMGLTNDPEQSKFVQNHANFLMDKDFLYRTDISKLSSPFDVASTLKNENGLFADQTAKAVNALRFLNKSENIKNKFNQNVKIGNALNERDIIGNSGEKNKQSFVGGNENIPDIQRYRSDVDLTRDHVPPSLMPMVCKEIDQLDRLSNLRNDFSGDIFLKKEKNYGINFITANYKCKEQDVMSENHYSLLITWSETPVRLFGGAYPKKVLKQCGFF